MAYENCFYIQNIDTVATTIKMPKDTSYVYYFQYSIGNTDNWVTPTSDLVDLEPNEKIYLKGTRTPSTAHVDLEQVDRMDNWFDLTAGKKVALGGSLMSLIHDGDGNDSTPVATPDSNWYYILSSAFRIPGNDGAEITITDLIIEDENLLQYQYYDLFYGDKYLGVYPAGFLGNPSSIPKGCYERMFGDAYSVEGDAVELPRLFSNDIDPEIPVGESGLEACFYRCKSVTSVDKDILPFVNIGKKAYAGMFGETSLTVMPTLPAAEVGEQAYQGMFNKTKLSVVGKDDLKIKKLNGIGELSGMFGQCPNLKEVHVEFKEFPFAESMFKSTGDWLYGTAGIGDFYGPSELVESVFERGTSSVPYGWSLSVYREPVKKGSITFFAKYSAPISKEE